MKYFSDNENGSLPRTVNEINHKVWCGISSYIDTLATTGFFGKSFPEQCIDNQGCIGTNLDAFQKALQAEIPNLDYPFITEKPNKNILLNEGKKPYVPSNLDVMDLIQFCFKNIGKPLPGAYHRYYSHYHIHSFDVKTGENDYVEKINTIFSRNGLAYELKPSGEIKRIISPSLEQMITNISMPIETELRNFLKRANEKIYSPNVAVRYDALRELWDFWERMKTAHNPARNKKDESVKLLLDSCSNDPKFRLILEEEAKFLTKVGNTFLIRHSEMSQVKVQDSEQIEYLYQRMLNLVYLLSKKFPF
ncbi:hypothetical protein V5049_10935 [Moellerella wisconsensis]|uniref:AbiJ-NTD4 domain-containing protein n=1 Tax=Moellerella wisconsensis TaxID=158849 RepID=UPI0030763408